MITSPHNPRLRLVRRLRSRRQRERLGLFVCEGEDVVAAALASGLAPVVALVDPGRPVLADELQDAEEVEPRLLAELSELAHPPRVLAVFRAADLPRFEPRAAAPTVGLALWRVSEPANVGALFRSADALGPAFVCLSEGCADPTGPKAVRSSMGALFRVPRGRMEDAPRPWAALLPDGAEPLWRVALPERVTFVLGSERLGLPDDVAASCDLRVTIPIAERAESLNVAAAGAIALYERRRREHAPDGGPDRRA